MTKGSNHKRSGYPKAADAMAKKTIYLPVFGGIRRFDELFRAVLEAVLDIKQQHRPVGQSQLQNHRLR